jgi:hypothetical protein
VTAVFFLTPNAQDKRKERCRKLLNKLKASQPHQVRIFFNEKIFTRDMAINFHNRCYLMDLPVADVKPSICISLFSKAPLRQMSWLWWAAMARNY